jgi:hypothetical protein
MAYDRFMIVPIDEGLQSDVKPWLISDKAFAKLKNAYVFRGSVRKRFGSSLLNEQQATSLDPLFSRLRINLGNTDGNGDIAGTAPGATFKAGQLFSIGEEIFTVVDDTPGAQDMLTTEAATTHTFDVATGNYDIEDADAATALYFYPAEPVMGLISYEVSAINDEPLYAFDTQFAYQFTGGAWTRLAAETVAGDALWTGTNSQFFWGITYRGASAANNILFITNFNNTDKMRYWDGAIWTTFRPLYDAATYIETARIIIPFHGRLLLLNTIENTNISFVNRCRYSQNGSPLSADAFREDIPGKGNFEDAPTKEAIISAQILKDRLIVFFERSTWELVYTGNHVRPFQWQKINSELGVESTFSIVPFDKVTLGVGNVGIHACNGANVERIDTKIPDEVFKIHNRNDGVLRVHGIRDYKVEMVYWTIPAEDGDAIYPNRVLVYNYKNNTWAFNDDSFTTFGYFQNTDDRRWQNIADEWQEFGAQWDGGVLEYKFRQVAAGNQQGFTFLLEADTHRNAPSLQITDIDLTVGVLTLTIIDHNLSNNEFIAIENAEGTVELNGDVYQIAVVDEDNITLDGPPAAITAYTGGGTAARISKIDILTKQYNFYAKQGKNVDLGKVDFNVNRTANGEITVSSFASFSNVSLSLAGIINNTLLGTGDLETSPYDEIPFEATQTQLWHSVYFQATGETVQLNLFLDDAQMEDTDIAWSDFQLNGMIFYTRPTGRLQ